MLYRIPVALWKKILDFVEFHFKYHNDNTHSFSVLQGPKPLSIVKFAKLVYGKVLF
jgi:hypothetical protein